MLWLGTNNRPFLADLVLYECVVETNLKCSLKIEKKFLLKQLFIKTKLLTFMIWAKCEHLNAQNSSFVVIFFGE